MTTIRRPLPRVRMDEPLPAFLVEGDRVAVVYRRRPQQDEPGTVELAISSDGGATWPKRVTVAIEERS